MMHTSNVSLDARSDSDSTLSSSDEEGNLVVHDSLDGSTPLNPEEEDDEATPNDDADGIRLALLSSSRTRRVHWGKERVISEWSEPGKRVFVLGILKETVPTLWTTVVGMFITGELLERVSTWRALQQLDELLILIPMLNNMKGNIEMNLSARLSTAANIGQLDTSETRREMLLGNLSLLQVQAIAMATLAAFFSFGLGKVIPPIHISDHGQNSTLGGISQRDVLYPLSMRIHSRAANRPAYGSSRSGLREFAIVLATALSAASLSSLTLGSFMCAVVVICRRFKLDPDNISPPIAACLGDLVTLTLLAFVATMLTSPSLSRYLLSVPALLLSLGNLGGSIYVSLRNPFARPLLRTGWAALVGAMIVSSGTGLVLENFVQKWEGYGALTVLISGLSGSVGSVFVSRLSTHLHTHADEAESASRSHRPTGSISSITRVRRTAVRPWLTCISLCAVALPVLVGYLVFADTAGWLDAPTTFECIFVLTTMVSMASSLWLGHVLTHALWNRGYDPDTYALPLHSSMVDLSSQLLLVLAYLASSLVGVDVQAPTVAG